MVKDYTATIEVAKSPESVFKIITEFPKWWVRDVSGQRAEFVGQCAKLNDEFILRHGGEHYSKHKLIEVVPDKKIVWLVTDSRLNWVKGNKEEWTGTRMIFEIVPKGRRTALIFTHQGLVPRLECYAHCVHFWDMVIKGWLSDFINEDKPRL